MSTMEVSVLLRLKDDLSAPAKKAAEAVAALTKGIEKLKALGAGMDTLPKQLKEAGAATRALQSDVRSFSSAFRAATDSARTMAKEMGAQRGRTWMASEVKNLKEMIALEKRLGSGPRYHGGGHGLGLLGAYYGAQTALHTTAHVFERGAALQNERALLDMAGYSGADQAKMIAGSRRASALIPTATEAQNLHRVRELNYALGNRLDMALHTLPDLDKLMTVIGASQGGDKARQVRDQIIESVKGAEIKNLITDEATFRKWLTFQGQSVLATGGLVQPTALFQTFKYARDAVHGWTQSFFPIVSELTQEFMTGKGGGSRGGAGSSLAAFGRYFVANTYAKKVTPWLSEEKLLGSDGRIVDGHLASQNPFEWTMKYLLPAMQRDKVNLNDHAAIAQWVSHLQGTENMRQLVQLMIIQRDQIKARIELYKKAMDYDQAYARSMNTLSQNVGALSAQTSQLQAVFVGPLLGPATGIVKAMSNLATWLWKSGLAHPEGLKLAEGLLGAGSIMALGSSLGRRLIGMGLGTGIGFFAGGGPLGAMMGGTFANSIMKAFGTSATAGIAEGATTVGVTMGRTAVTALIRGLTRSLTMAWVWSMVLDAVGKHFNPEARKRLDQSYDDDKNPLSWHNLAVKLGASPAADLLTDKPLASSVKDLHHALTGDTGDAKEKGKYWAQSFLDMVKSLLSGATVRGPNVNLPGLPIGQPHGNGGVASPARGIGHASLQIHRMEINVHGGGAGAHETAQAVWDRFNSSVQKQLSDGAFA